MQSTCYLFPRYCSLDTSENYFNVRAKDWTMLSPAHLRVPGNMELLIWSVSPSCCKVCWWHLWNALNMHFNWCSTSTELLKSCIQTADMSDHSLRLLLESSFVSFNVLQVTLGRILLVSLWGRLFATLAKYAWRQWRQQQSLVAGCQWHHWNGKIYYYTRIYFNIY